MYKVLVQYSSVQLSASDFNQMDKSRKWQKWKLNIPKVGKVENFS